MSEVRKETKDPLTKAETKWDRLSSERITSVCEYLTSEEQELQGVSVSAKYGRNKLWVKCIKRLKLITFMTRSFSNNNICWNQCLILLISVKELKLKKLPVSFDQDCYDTQEKFENLHLIDCKVEIAQHYQILINKL